MVPTTTTLPDPPARIDRHSVVTWPNAVTMARLGLTVPLCWWLLGDGGGPAPGWVVAATVAWAGSDWLDGALARRLGQVTRSGEVLDPVADRLGVLAVCLCLAAADQLAWWPVLVVGVTDVVVLAGVGRAAASGRLRVSPLGRVRTATLLIGLTTLVIGVLQDLGAAEAGRWMVAVGAVLHLATGLDYLRRARWSAARP